MSRDAFDRKLLDVKHNLIRMGAYVEGIIDMSVTALKGCKQELAERVGFEDNNIDKLDIEIENECMALLALQQPLAKDLRTIATVMKIITDLERMGDNAVNIAKITLQIGRKPEIKLLPEISDMSKKVQKIVKLSLDAFVNEDIALAQEVSGMDEEVDNYYEKIVNDMLILISENRDIAFEGTRILLVGRYLERIADHATNICERVIYMVTGELKEIN